MKKNNEIILEFCSCEIKLHTCILQSQFGNIIQIEEIDEYDKFWVSWFNEGNVGILIKPIL